MFKKLKILSPLVNQQTRKPEQINLNGQVFSVYSNQVTEEYLNLNHIISCSSTAIAVSGKDGTPKVSKACAVAFVNGSAVMLACNTEDVTGIKEEKPKKKPAAKKKPASKKKK